MPLASHASARAAAKTTARAISCACRLQHEHVTRRVPRHPCRPRSQSNRGGKAPRSGLANRTPLVEGRYPRPAASGNCLEPHGQASARKEQTRTATRNIRATVSCSELVAGSKIMAHFESDPSSRFFGLRSGWGSGLLTQQLCHALQALGSFGARVKPDILGTP